MSNNKENFRPKRRSAVLDDDIYKKLLEIQAKRISKSISSVSFSSVVNEVLRKGLK